MYLSGDGQKKVAFLQIQTDSGNDWLRSEEIKNFLPKSLE